MLYVSLIQSKEYMEREGAEDLPDVEFVSEEVYLEASVAPQMSREDGQTIKRTEKAGICIYELACCAFHLRQFSCFRLVVYCMLLQVIFTG